MPIAATIDYLRGLKQQGVHLGLERMRGLMAALGNPQERYPVIHIAGTNGKGSVAAMLEALFRGAGWRTGLYTSPHLVRLGERVQVDREPLSDAELSDEVRQLRSVVEELVAAHGPEAGPSYFEFMTALAFAHFRRTRCDLAIVEVGMGGRLDATNVVNPEVSVITSIGLDHVEFLGRTIDAIAAEKSGIIKRGRPVVIGRLPAEAERVVRAVADAQGSAVVSLREEFGDDISTYPRTNLGGAYQQVNAATASLVAAQFDPVWRVGKARVASALLQVDWPARWQELDVGGRRVVIDATHNAEGAQTLDANLAQLVADAGMKPVIVVGVLGRARAEAVLGVVCRHAAELRLVLPQQKRACSFAELESLVPAYFRGKVVRSALAEVFPRSSESLPELPAMQPLVVTGSIYLAGEALAAIDPTRGPVEHDLQDF